MAKPKRKKISFLKLLLLIPTVINFANRLVMLFGYEVRRSKKSILLIIVLSLMMGMLITTVWLCILTLLFIYLTSIQWTPHGALGLIIILNLMGIVILSFMIKKLKRNLFFPLLTRTIARLFNQD